MQARFPLTMSRRKVGLLAMAVVFGTTAAAYAQKPRLDVVYVPTPQNVVDRMLEMVAPKKDEIHWDLGSGDGRIVVTAAKRYGTRSFGVDIDPDRIAEAKENAKKAGVEDRVEFRQGNLYETDFSKANVLTMYLLEEINLKLQPKILAELQPGTRLVSHAFQMGAWKADQEDSVEGRRVFMWIVPARVEGSWKVQNGERSFVLKVNQQFQNFVGTADIDGKSVEIKDGKLNGAEISFAVAVDGKPQTFRGTVDGNSITGEGGWKATKS